MAEALVKLTAIAGQLAGGTRTSANPSLEGALDALGTSLAAPGAEGPTGGNLGVRSGATARLLAEQAVRDRPELIYSPMEALMSAALPANSRNLDGSASARTWLEMRSRLSDHRPSINIAWAVAAIHE